MAADDLLTIKEVAAILRVSWITLWRLRKRGEGPVSKRVGYQIRYRRADIDQWLKDQK